MKYIVPRVNQPTQPDLDWDGPVWQDITPLELRNHMGERPDHFPRVQAKLAYDERALLVIFNVADRYVRAVAREHQDAVCRDSCVEFFFTPGDDVSQGYINLEMNCGGTMLMHYQKIPRRNAVPVASADLARIEVAHELPKVVEPEITEQTQWTVSYRLPWEVIAENFPTKFTRPAPGVRWRANLYKCGDATSHPHWLTWSPVDAPQPDFHLPEQFGTLEFR